ncbi:MAG TPA: LuxR C-terminal-related transcriptional regulator [Bacteroidia bacterium]|nr:LuxR C-terminal-related transcriptional regulator [Bacteroidia bacterium]
MKKELIIYGGLCGLLIVVLKLVEYRFLILDNKIELYGGAIALVFVVLGIWFGSKMVKRKEVVVIKEVRIDNSRPFVLNEIKLKEIGISKREYEILEQISKGLSNKEIADKLSVSENTVKTHSSRIFEKLDVNKRMQAIQKAKELGLIP